VAYESYLQAVERYRHQLPDPEVIVGHIGPTGILKCAMCIRLDRANGTMTNAESEALFDLAERIPPLRRAYGRRKGHR